MKRFFLSSCVFVMVLSCSIITQTEMARAAQQAFRVKILQSFGCGYTEFTDGWCKVMVKTQRGNKYFVWYYDSIGAPIGSNVIVTYDDYYGWVRLTNAENGKEARIGKVLKIES